MDLNDTKTNEEPIAEQLRSDPEFRADWDRTALARAVAFAIIGYRAEHDLSQRDLAQRLGMKQPQVARLELGEVNPSMDTLMRLSSQLGMAFTIDVRPAASHNVDARPWQNPTAAKLPAPSAEILVATRRVTRGS